MSYYGGGSCCGNTNYPTYGYPAYQYGNNNTSTFAIILVLFILLVIVLGCRWTR